MRLGTRPRREGGRGGEGGHSSCVSRYAGYPARDGSGRVACDSLWQRHLAGVENAQVYTKILRNARCYAVTSLTPGDKTPHEMNSMVRYPDAPSNIGADE